MKTPPVHYDDDAPPPPALSDGLVRHLQNFAKMCSHQMKDARGDAVAAHLREAASRIAALETENLSWKAREEMASRRITELEAEREEARNFLAGTDIASLPNDMPLVKIAYKRMEDRYKFMWQVRDTCARAEKAEAERDAAEARITELEAERGDKEAECSGAMGAWRCARDERDDALEQVRVLREAAKEATDSLARNIVNWGERSQPSGAVLKEVNGEREEPKRKKSPANG